MADIGTEVLFIAGFGPIDHDVAESRKLYADSLGISLKEDAGGYLYTAALQGAKHFALGLSRRLRSPVLAPIPGPITLPSRKHGSNLKWKMCILARYR
jgi:hypothetical protein